MTKVKILKPNQIPTIKPLKVANELPTCDVSENKTKPENKGNEKVIESSQSGCVISLRSLNNSLMQASDTWQEIIVDAPSFDCSKHCSLLKAMKAKVESDDRLYFVPIILSGGLWRVIGNAPQIVFG